MGVGRWRGLSARINHSSNLREITPCNHSARFVISGPRRVKYGHAVAPEFKLKPVRVAAARLV